MKKLLSILFILFSCPIIFAQYTISGYLKDGETGESMIGATIIVDGTSNGTVSNVYGFFSLKVDTSDVTIVYSFVGYSPIKKTYSLTGDVREDLELAPALLDAVEITATKSEKIQETTQMSTIDIPIDQIKKITSHIRRSRCDKSLTVIARCTIWFLKHLQVCMLEEEGQIKT